MPESSARTHQTGAIDNREMSTHPAVQGNHAEAFASGGFSGFYDAARDPLLLGRRVEVVQQINLTRVDQRFAVKAQLFDVGGFLQESGFVVSVGIDGIERLNTRKSAQPAKWNSGANSSSVPSGSVLYAGCAHSLLHRGRYRSNARKRERFPLRG